MSMPTRDAIFDVLRKIPDPEMPISIVDLGIVDRVEVSANGSDDASVVVDILPTFVGCPALDMIRDEVREKVGAMSGVGEVDVNFIHDPPWTVDRITDAGRASLKEHGVTVPESGSKLAVHDSPRIMTQVRTSAVPCPFCGSSSTCLDSPFGPTRCRMIFYCESCRNSFEHMKRV
jgi:ring-1,2-phenylacetyl-CoA epoxidase subunit PaaD